MADIGLRSGKVRAGFYRCGPFCIHKGPHGWGVYRGPDFIRNFGTLSDAYNWARYDTSRRNPTSASAGDGCSP